LSFYVTKTVLVGPKWFWSDQIDLDLTIMIWSWPKWIGQVQMWFILVENHDLDLTISFWLRPNHYGQVQINLVRPKSFWTDQNCFGHIEGQGIHLPRFLSDRITQIRFFLFFRLTWMNVRKHAKLLACILEICNLWSWDIM
jgi:hypothetical protein